MSRSMEHPRSRWVAVGDSLSEGLGDPLPGGSLRSWASLFAEHLRQVAPQLQFTNLAVHGHHTRDAIHRQLPAALAVQPDLVTVFIRRQRRAARPAPRPRSIR
jgi:lysophospholipase L1-like esterase